MVYEISQKDYIEGLRSRDERAYTRLMKECHGTAKIHSSRNEDQRDLAQETAIKVYDKIYSFDTGRDFNAWRNAIMRRTWIDMLKKARSEENRIMVLSQQRPSRVSEVDNELARKIMYEITHGTLLTDDERQVLRLQYLHGNESPTKIAATMKVPAGTVKSLLHRGRQKLRKNYTDSN